MITEKIINALIILLVRGGYTVTMAAYMPYPPPTQIQLMIRSIQDLWKLHLKGELVCVTHGVDDKIELDLANPDSLPKLYAYFNFPSELVDAFG